jgi:hypothetical protein
MRGVRLIDRESTTRSWKATRVVKCSYQTLSERSEHGALSVAEQNDFFLEPFLCTDYLHHSLNGE